MEDRKSLGSSIAAIFDDGDDIIKRSITGEHTDESLAVRCDSVQLKLKKRMKVRKKSWFRTVTQCVTEMESIIESSTAYKTDYFFKGKFC